MDGGSTDGTLDLISSYRGKIRWRSQLDDGAWDAITEGFKLTKGEIVGWLNDDDCLAPGAVALAVKYLERNPGVDVIYGDYFAVDPSGKIGKRHVTKTWDLDRAVVECDHIIPQAGSFMRRSILEKVGGLWPDWCHDHELWLRIALAGGNIRRIPAVLGYSREHSENLGYNSDLVIPLKLKITRSFFARSDCPRHLRQFEARALSNTYLRGIGYVNHDPRFTDQQRAERIAELLLLASDADPTNGQRISRHRPTSRIVDKQKQTVIQRQSTRRKHRGIARNYRSR